MECKVKLREIEILIFNCKRCLNIPLNLIGFTRQPKWGHLRELHSTIKQCSETLLSGVPSKWSLGENQEV